MRIRGRERRHLRIRRKLSGSAQRPRLAVYRSNRHLYALLIDDGAGRTLLSVSTLAPELRAATGKPVERARAVGRLIAEKATSRGITKVVFDRSGYRYHGRVQALAAAAREGGLVF